MSKLPEPYITGQFIVVKYEYPGFTVHIQTDYTKGLISIVEPKDNESYLSEFVEKKWLFANREIEYMSGWRYIFECLADATRRAEADLVAYKSAEKEHKNQKIVDILVAAEKYRSDKK